MWKHIFAIISLWRSFLRRFPSEPPPQGSHSSTSPQLLISRFAHQLKQESPPPLSSATMPPQQQGASSKESAKKRFASYVRLRLGSERAPSPEPPPRLSRGESPLVLRKNLIEQVSPSCPRRYVYISYFIIISFHCHAPLLYKPNW